MQSSQSTTPQKSLKAYFNRYFIDAMSYMATGLMASLIIGLIIAQLSKLPLLGFLAPYAAIVGAQSPVVGAAVGAAIAYGFGSKALVICGCLAAGAFGYQAGGPVGAYIGGVFGAEIGRLVAGKTKVDIIITPIVTLCAGSFFAGIAGPYVQAFMTGLGNAVNQATELTPFYMSIAVALLVGCALSAPISSAALCIMLDLSGLAAGAATAGCCAQMVGFAVASFKDNGFGGVVAQGLGTTMIQFPNIVRTPQIWLAPTLTAMILGPVSTVVFKMRNIATAAGMGTSGLVGPFGAFATMAPTEGAGPVLVKIALLYFILPAVLTLAFHLLFKRLGWVKDGDMKLANL